MIMEKKISKNFFNLNNLKLINRMHKANKKIFFPNKTKYLNFYKNQ